MSDLRQANKTDRLSKVLLYIDRHLAEDLSVARLAAITAWSKAHFQRQFTAFMGVSVRQYIRMMRLRQAAYQLRYRDDQSITEIAYKAGFEAPESLARLFRHKAEMPPRALRQTDNDQPFSALLVGMTRIEQKRQALLAREFSLDQIEIRPFPETRVARLTHCGNQEELHRNLRRFIAWRRQVGCAPSKSATYNIFSSHIVADVTADFTMELCAETNQAIAENQFGVEAHTMPAANCAVLQVVGDETSLQAAMQYMLQDRLPKSAYRPADAPSFIKRLTLYPDVPASLATSEIYVPLKLGPHMDEER